MNKNYIYIFIMAGVSFLIRALPMTLFRKQIKSKFVQSFLYYVPYACLTAMTFPAALYATGSILSAAVGLAVAILVSMKSKSLTFVALSSAVAVGLCECVLMLF